MSVWLWECPCPCVGGQILCRPFSWDNSRSESVSPTAELTQHPLGKSIPGINEAVTPMWLKVQALPPSLKCDGVNIKKE